MVTKSWSLKVDKHGVLTVVYLNERGLCKTYTPKSEEALIRGTGIEFPVSWKGRVSVVECLFKDMLLDKRQPLPVAKMLELGTFDESAVRRLRSHVLGFVYEFIGGVCFDRNPIIVRKPPFDIDALLAEYSQFKSQLGTVDWHAVAEQL